MQKGEKDREKPGILFSCYSHNTREGEQFVPAHVFSYTLAGSSEVNVGGKTYLFKEGDFRFFKKKSIGKIYKTATAWRRI